MKIRTEIYAVKVVYKGITDGEEDMYCLPDGNPLPVEYAHELPQIGSPWLNGTKVASVSTPRVKVTYEDNIPDSAFTSVETDKDSGEITIAANLTSSQTVVYYKCVQLADESYIAHYREFLSPEQAIKI